MARKTKEQPDPMAAGKGRIDEVDQSKGIFRLDTPHPPDAELRAPGTLGGGPYEESGRGGLSSSSEGQPLGTGAGAAAAEAADRAQDRQEPGDEAAKEAAPVGALPQHEEQRR